MVLNISTKLKFNLKKRVNQILLKKQKFLDLQKKNFYKKLKLHQQKYNFKKKFYKKYKKYKIHVVPKRLRINFAMRFLRRNIYVKKQFKNLLIAKQSFRFFFGRLSNSQLNNVLKINKKKNFCKDSISKIFEMFERKLPITILRLNFIPTIVYALQMIIHGRILINGKVVTYPWYTLADGDIIECLDDTWFKRYYQQTNYKSKNLRIFRKERFRATHLLGSKRIPLGIFIRAPKIFELTYPQRYRVRILRFFVDNIL